MGEVTHNKLVRDLVPDAIRADGHEPVTRTLADSERLSAILDKVCEEASELRESDGDLYEFADVYTAFKAAVRAKGYAMEQVEQAAAKKTAERGGFDDWIFLEKVIEK